MKQIGVAGAGRDKPAGSRLAGGTSDVPPRPSRVIDSGAAGKHRLLRPGHGFLRDQAREKIKRLSTHRLSRENKVLAALYHGRSTLTARRCELCVVAAVLARPGKLTVPYL